MKFIFAILITMVLVGCSDDPNNEKASSTDTEQLSQNNQPQSSEIIVQIGPGGITKDELMAELSKLSQKQRAIYTSSPEKLNEFLQDRINQQVLYNEAHKRGIHERERVKQLLEDYERKLIAKTFGREILDEIEISDEEILEYYEYNKKDYQRIDISKIEIKYLPSEESSKEPARDRAQVIFEKIQSGENYEQLSADNLL